MDVIKCIKERRSVRKYKDQKIDHALFEKIIETARFAPSWKNTQTTRYIVVEDRDIINEIADNCVCGFKFNSSTIKKAAALVVMTVVKGRCGYEKDGSYSTSKEDRWEMFDAGVAAQTFCLAAHEEGLGSVIIGVFEDDKVGKLIDVPEGQYPSALIAIGYPDEEPIAPKRKEVSDLLSFK